MKDVTIFLARNLKVSLNKPVVVAVSGGPDSMALLALIHEYNPNLKIVVAHVNHNIRDESDVEEKFVREYCESNDFIFETTKFDDYSDGNFHSEARKRRYIFFEEVLNKYKAKYLFTAHHADDLIETILMRMTRGSTLKGYSGFSSVIEVNEHTLLRPLINLTKEEIITYCHDNNIPYVVDKSNEASKYTRNRFRKDVLTFLKKENPKVHRQFKKFSDLLNKYDDFVSAEVDECYEKIMEDRKINIKKFTKKHILLKELIIRKILDNIYEEDIIFITDVHIVSILKLLNSTKANAYIELPLGIEVHKNYDFLDFVKKPVLVENYKIELQDHNIIDGRFVITKIDETRKDTNNICRLNKEELTWPLYLRNRIDGDLIEVRGLNGKKKIKDIFIDEKVSVDKRNRLPILVDSDDNVIWIPGIKKSKYCKKISENYDIILQYDEEVCK